jgi:aryl-alcohol dehydrogenase
METRGGIEALAAVQRERGAAPVIERIRLEEPRPDEVLVRIVGTGVCHTDMVMRDQLVPTPFPAVLGHEGAGVVERVGGDVEGLAPGDHVVLSFASCGSCPSCGHSEPAYCHSWFPLNFMGMRSDGSSAITDAGGHAVHSHIFGQSSFATHAVVNARNAVLVDPAIPLELLGPLGCGLQTGAGAILNSLKVRPGASVAVLGTGAVGLSAVMAARIAGASTIVAVDLKQQRGDIARELGATQGTLPKTGGMLEVAADAGLPNGFDYIVDTTGSAAVGNDAILALAPRGEIALVGAYPPAAELVCNGTHILSGGRVIRGVVEGGAEPHSFIPKLIGHWQAGRFPFDRLIEFFPLSEIDEAIRLSEEGLVVKPVILMEPRED